MQILFPWGLLALTLIPVLLLIHLLRVPGRLKLVSHLPLWNKVLSKTPALRVSARRRLDVLFLLEALIVALLALALAQTASRWAAPPGGPNVALVLDLTASMNARSPEGLTRWDSARILCRGLLKQFDENDEVTLFRCFGPQATTGQRLTVGQVQQLLAETEPGQLAGSGEELLEKIVIPAAERHDAVFFITDSLTPDATASVGPSVRCATVGRPCENVGITRFSSRRARDGRVQVFLSVLNSGTLPHAGKVRLSGSAKMLAEKKLSIAPGGSSNFVFDLKLDASDASIDWLLSEIILDGGRDGFETDDRVLAKAMKLNVVLAGEQSKSLRKFFRNVFPDTVVLTEFSDGSIRSRLSADLVVAHRTTWAPDVQTANLVMDPKGERLGDVVLGERKRFGTGSILAAGDDVLMKSVDVRSIRMKEYRPLKVPKQFRPLLWVDSEVVGAISRTSARKPQIVLGFSPDEGWGKDPSFVIFMVNVLREVTGTGRPPDEPFVAVSIRTFPPRDAEKPALLSATESTLPARQLLSVGELELPEDVSRSNWGTITPILLALTAVVLFLWWSRT